MKKEQTVQASSESQFFNFLFFSVTLFSQEGIDALGKLVLGALLHPFLNTICQWKVGELFIYSNSYTSSAGALICSPIPTNLYPTPGACFCSPLR
jgi:hypothetical protein